MTATVHTTTFGEYQDAVTLIKTVAADTTWHDVHALVMHSDWHRNGVVGLLATFDADNPAHVAQLTDRANRTATIAAAKTFAAERRAWTATIRQSDDSPLVWRFDAAADSPVTVSSLVQMGDRGVYTVDAIAFETTNRAPIVVPAAVARVYPTDSIYI